MRHRGTLRSWKEFARPQFRKKYAWCTLKSDGVYCKYCMEGNFQGHLLSGSAVFVTEPFTGCRPDKLLQHECSVSHNASASAYRESS